MIASVLGREVSSRIDVELKTCLWSQGKAGMSSGSDPVAMIVFVRLDDEVVLAADFDFVRREEFGLPAQNRDPVG